MRNLKKEFSKIYDQNIEKIYRFIFLKVNSQEIAEDLTSEVFLKAWKAFKKPNSKSKNQNEIENPQAFLYQIAKNLVTDFYRKKEKNRIVSLENFQIKDPKEDLEKKAILTSDLEQIKRALQNLKEEYQEVIIWRYLDELSISQIAKIIEKSEEAVRIMIHRALKELKLKIENNDY
jgi:RNA polymerase sigma-70 factor (ECF subfamily)